MVFKYILFRKLPFGTFMHFRVTRIITLKNYSRDMLR